MEKPWVSIICTCFNQGKFVRATLDSVAQQSYENVELIVVDNGSSDGSVEKIKAWIEANDRKNFTLTFFHESRLNYCRVFNEALNQSKGDYVIDLAGDDCLYPDHVARSVMAFRHQPSAAVCSSNAHLSREGSQLMPTFFPTDSIGKTIGWKPEGDIYLDVIKKYCVCTPSMVFNAELLKKEGGYDENLVYEDFDVIARLSRKYSFIYSDHIGVRKRLHNQSFSAKQYSRKDSEMIWSTLEVCEKLAGMNCREAEDHALVFRCLHEAKHALASANFEAGKRLLNLAKQVGTKGPKLWIYQIWEVLRLDLSFFYERFKAN